LHSSDATVVPTPHHPKLAHHFDNLEQQKEASTLGMWIFLVNEIMFFGGMFTAYLVYRHRYFDAFAAGSNTLDLWAGAINTAILIGSSLTVVLAVYAAQMGRRRSLILWLVLTMVLGAAFLGIKAYEYAHKFEEHHVPGPSFHIEPNDPHFKGVDPQRAQLYFSLYFAMTGMHALHMIIGLGVFSWLTWNAYKGRFTVEYHSPVEIGGLYWHFVDIVWIFLFPLLYLISRHPTH
jgi:cytochrome c oxidase subunit III